MHPMRSGRHPPRAGTPSTHLTRVQNFPHPTRHALMPGCPHMQAMPPPIPHIAPHVQPHLSCASHTSGPLPPSHMPRPCPDARPSSYAGHAPGHPHIMLPCPAALVCKPHTCPSLMPCPCTRPHSFAGHPPGRPHTTPPYLAVLVCRSCARPSLTPRPHARLPSFARHMPAHHSCHTPTPRQPGSL